MKLNKDFVDGVLDTGEFTLKDLCKAISYPVYENTYDFKMGLAIATYDEREVLYNEDSKEVVRQFNLVLPNHMEVDPMTLMYPVQQEIQSFCLPTISTVMVNPKTLVTFNKPYLSDGTIYLVFVVYLKSKETGTFMSHLNTNSMIFRKNFTDNDFTEMDKESKLFIESVQITNKGE